MLKPFDQAWPERYAILDGLRGLACMGVLLHHLGVIAVGHYSVMIFFVISGYCITASAQSCLRRGVSFGAFMARRIRRICPPYLIAVAFFALTRWLKALLTDGPPWHATWLDWLQNLTLTQWLSVPFEPIAWPMSNPTLFVTAFWSLNYEEQFYLAVGLLLLLATRCGISLTRGVLAALAVGLAWNFAWPGGWITGLFIEYWAHFAAGACLHFVLCVHPQVAMRALFLGAATLLTALSLWQVLSWDGGETELARRAYVELTTVGLTAIVLLVIRPFSDRLSHSLWWRPIAALGAISYSLYLVHQFNLTLVGTVADYLTPDGTPAAVLVIVKVMLHLCIAAGFWYLCERPFLNRRLPAPEQEERRIRVPVRRPLDATASRAASP